MSDEIARRQSVLEPSIRSALPDGFERGDDADWPAAAGRPLLRAHAFFALSDGLCEDDLDVASLSPVAVGLELAHLHVTCHGRAIAAADHSARSDAVTRWVLQGDVLLSRAFEQALELDAPRRIRERCFAVLTRATGRVHRALFRSASRTETGTEPASGSSTDAGALAGAASQIAGVVCGVGEDRQATLFDRGSRFGLLADPRTGCPTYDGAPSDPAGDDPAVREAIRRLSACCPDDNVAAVRRQLRSLVASRDRDGST